MRKVLQFKVQNSVKLTLFMSILLGREAIGLYHMLEIVPAFRADKNIQLWIICVVYLHWCEENEMFFVSH